MNIKAALKYQHLSINVEQLFISSYMQLWICRLTKFIICYKSIQYAMNSNDDQNDYHLMMNVDAIMNKTLTVLFFIVWLLVHNLWIKFNPTFQQYIGTSCSSQMFIEIFPLLMPENQYLLTYDHKYPWALQNKRHITANNLNNFHQNYECWWRLIQKQSIPS